MLTIYRATSIKSTNPSPLYQDDKDTLNMLCLKSFVRAYKDIKPDIYFLLDFCPEKYRDMMSEIVPKDWKATYEFTRLGINDTMLRAYEIANGQDDDILFQECDYFYRDGVGGAMIGGLKELGLVSPYDHLNFYVDKTLHSPHITMKLVGDTHWRTTERNTMTFAVKNKILKDHYEIFKHYGYLDGNVWYDLLEKGHFLWVPVPSFATHMVKDWLAPSVGWDALWKNQNTP